MPTNESYRKSDCCGGCDCDRLGTFDDEPCWGRMTWAVYDMPPDEDGYTPYLPYYHACEGHVHAFDPDAGPSCIPEPTDGENPFVPQRIPAPHH